MKTIYYCDFDGTIALADVGNEVNKRFSGPEWDELAKAYIRGEIDSITCLTNQYASFNASEVEFREFILSLNLDPYFPVFLDSVRRRGDHIVVLSDGMRNYIDILFEKYSIEGVEIYSNYFEFEENRVKLFFPHVHPDCVVRMANCKCSHISPSNHLRKVYIGDGMSDACGARKTEQVYAKENSNLYRVLEEEKFSFIPFKSFKDVMESEGVG